MFPVETPPLDLYIFPLLMNISKNSTKEIKNRNKEIYNNPMFCLQDDEANAPSAPDPPNFHLQERGTGFCFDSR